MRIQFIIKQIFAFVGSESKYPNIIINHLYRKFWQKLQLNKSINIIPTSLTQDIDIQKNTPSISVTTCKIHLCRRSSQRTCPEHHDSRDKHGATSVMSRTGEAWQGYKDLLVRDVYFYRWKACGKWVQSLTQKTPGCLASPPSSFNRSPPPPPSGRDALWGKSLPFDLCGACADADRTLKFIMPLKPLCISA